MASEYRHLECRGDSSSAPFRTGRAGDANGWECDGQQDEYRCRLFDRLDAARRCAAWNHDIPDERAQAGTTVATATMPVVVGWFNGQHARYISPEASDAAAGVPQANFSMLVGRSANPNAVVPIYTVPNFKQGNIIPSAPIPTGPKNPGAGYSPLWQVSTVTWKSGMTPSLLKSSDDVQAALADGKVAIAKTNIVVNCPVIYTPLGGLLPGVTVATSEN